MTCISACAARIVQPFSPSLNPVFRCLGSPLPLRAVRGKCWTLGLAQDLAGSGSRRRAELATHPAPSTAPPEKAKSGRRGSNPRPSAWEADALPAELRPRAENDSAPPLAIGRAGTSLLPPGSCCAISPRVSTRARLTVLLLFALIGAATAVATSETRGNHKAVPKKPTQTMPTVPATQPAPPPVKTQTTPTTPKPAGNYPRSTTPRIGASSTPSSPRGRRSLPGAT